ncbi:uncharacterized protein PV09_03843 [Verruconis gallopava]|uniref:Rhodopsin domain-containing protein n=1 Tax=Verruconis gallopava TaxID=253628 RepID=A0A0D1XRK3_9PEZI|nr:uncharacterized protein PV09_03843 [Verruconis gallopava]KIW05321.1 hypothetical protein PV09_03843 [Verruconis gallopava]
MQLPSAEQLAQWPTPNYENPVRRGDALVIVDSVFLGFATLLVALRLYTRLAVRKWFGLDDIFIVLAYASTVALNAVMFEGLRHYGWDRHTWDVPLTWIQRSAHLAYVGKLLYIMAVSFTAFALIAFYYRLIAESGSSWFRIALHLTLAYNIAVSIGCDFFAEMFMCTPISFYWTIDGPPGAHCIPEPPVTFSSGCLKLFSDVLLTTLPLPLVFRLELRRRQRYMVAILFALGYVVTGAGAARVYFTYKSFFTDGDSIWWQYPTFICATIENDLGIICACAPTIRPLFPKFFGGPLSRVKGWISTHNPSSKSSRDVSEAKRTSNLSQLGSHIRSFGLSRSTETNHDTDDDIELVIQKNYDLGKDGNHSHRDVGFDFDLPEKESSKLGVQVNSTAAKPMSMVSISSGNESIHPFDPRLDVENQALRFAP